MLKLWLLAGSAFVVFAAYAARRLRRRHDLPAVSLPSLSDQWLAEQRGQRDDH